MIPKFEEKTNYIRKEEIASVVVVPFTSKFLQLIVATSSIYENVLDSNVVRRHARQTSDVICAPIG